ncbi:MAG TPA: PilX N-terminal domain-containing pilus assembly protein [Burkholderiales bacterium]|nr:PilX N-terminal domain-containing pilus assembly protein [Burkholderiales bacterium]
MGASARSREQGAALVVALMFLIILTLLGLATMTGTTLEERMAGNSRDYNVALQAAEAALRDAEADLKGTGVSPLRAITVTAFPVDLIGNVTTPSGCQTTGGTTTGLCIIGSETTQLYNTSTVSWSSGSSTTAAYGQFTGASSLTGVSSQPRYFMELMQFADGRNKDRVSGASGTVDYYYVRITARGWGQGAQTQVTLQEVFIIALPT